MSTTVKAIVRILCRPVIVVATMSHAAFAQSAATSDSALRMRIDSVFARLNVAGSPGCAVGVARDGKPPILLGYGSASIEYGVPITATTTFEAASVAKQFTAASIVLLAEAGKLTLDDDVHRYVPELPVYQDPITLRQLMHHTSGLRDQWDLLWLSGGRDDDPTEDEDVLDLIFRQRDLNFRPGSEFLYSNSGYTLLALVVKRVSGVSLREFAEERLFAPLGMTHTFFLDDRFKILKDVASGYRMARSSSWGRSPYLYDTYGPGGVFTTTEDLLRWNESLGDGRLAGGALTREALRRGTLMSGDSVPYSMGLDLGTYRRHKYIAHGGNNLGASAYAIQFIDDRLSIAVLCNGRELDAYTLARQTAGLFIAVLPAPGSTGPQRESQAVSATVDVSAVQLAGYAGIYFNAATLATRKVDVRNGRLIWARGTPGTPLDAVAPNRFRFPPGTPAELVFPALRQGESQMMQLISGASVTEYRRGETFVAPVGGIATFGGSFYSDELDVTWKLRVVNDSLEVGTHGSWSFRPQPILRDTFALVEAVVMRFTRDNRGRIDGFIADMPRTRGIRFRKVRS
jgi:CubicO group peptidase (beta-lactamase class C family)